MTIGIQSELCGFVLYIYNKSDIGKDGKLKDGAKEYHEYFDEVTDMEKCIEEFKKRAMRAIK